MIAFRLILFMLFLFCYTQLYAQSFQLLDVSLNYNYTTTSRLFLHPYSSDPIVRASYESLDDIFSFSGEVRIQILESLVGSIWLESIKKTFTNDNFNLGGTKAKIKDGYEIYPVEISLYYLLPFSTERFKFFMGGGGGLYFGKHIRQLGDVSIFSDGSKIGYGIQVSLGMDYLIYDFISVRTQMRFRDPEVELKSKYTNTTVTYEGKKYQIAPTTFSSKVNIDGITFCAGIVFHFK